MRKLIKIFLGWLAAPAGLLSYAVIRKKNCHDVLICDHVGDLLYTTGYLRSFKKFNHISYLRIISTERLKDVVRLFPGASEEYRAVNRFFLDIMLFPYRYSLGKLIYRHLKNVTVIEPSRDFAEQYEYVTAFPNLTLRDCIKYGILKLPEDVEMDMPRLEKNMELKKIGKKSVLLCPVAVVTEWKQAAVLFDKLSLFLKEHGYDVFINDESMPLNEFASLAAQMDCVIGIRSGLMDLASLAGCPVIALYPKDNKMMRYFDLRKMNDKNKKIMQYRMTDNVEADISNLMRSIQDKEY